MKCLMLRIGVKAIFAGVVCSLVMVSVGCSKSVCRHVDLAWIANQIPLPDGARIVQAKEKGELCEVILAINGGLAPIYAGGDFILAGQLFKNGRSITQETLKTMSDIVEAEKEILAEQKAQEKEERKAFFKKNIKVMDELVSLSFNSGQARDFFYVITDPNCSHCKALLPKLELAALESGLEIRVIIYPLLGDRSRQMAAQAICNRYSYGAYAKIKQIEPFDPCERADHLIENTIDFFQSAGLRFVPLVVAGDGSWVVESNHNTMVREYLGLEAQGEEAGVHGTCNSVSEQ